MLDHVEVARILDILGNRNRRRIIDLLRQKPCFVTEISDRLMLSPKAVIEHLQMMEREEILSFRLDERRRKYYFLANDINVVVSLNRMDTVNRPRTEDTTVRLRISLLKLKKMVGTRDELAASLHHLDQDIDVQIKEVVRQGKSVFSGGIDTELAIALAHYDLTLDELEEVTSIPSDALKERLDMLKKQKLIEQKGDTFRLCGVNAE
jgi:ArsR family transcriptional regulator